MSVSRTVPMIYAHDSNEDEDRRRYGWCESIEKRHCLEKSYAISMNGQLFEKRMHQPYLFGLITLLTKKHPPNILLLGKSGAGKGTISQMLADRYGYVHLSIGDIHRRENQKGTKIGLKIRELVAQNKISSPEMAKITYAILSQKLRELILNRKPFILDNFPTCPLHVPFMLRTISRYRLGKKIVLVEPQISDAEALTRLENRLVCTSEGCGRSYHLIYMPPTLEGRCDFCASPLCRRIDDTAEIIKAKRLPFYRENILPAIRLLAKHMEFFAVPKPFDLFANTLQLLPNNKKLLVS
jgi:adenylate kinase